MIPTLLSAFRGACVVACVHRLELLPLFDQVVSLDGEGLIVVRDPSSQ